MVDTGKSHSCNQGVAEQSRKHHWAWRRGLRPSSAGTTEIIASASEFASGWLSVKKMDVDALVARLKGRRVVVFIDDLDRADPVAIPKTLLALRELLDWPSFAFVLAFDRRVVGQALGDYSKAYGENANAFLEKIVDVPFTIPTPTKEQQRALAVQSFSACCSFVPTPVAEKFAALFPYEPRRVKLIARCIGALRDVAQRHNPEAVLQ
jgi:KAP family P-loop domain